MSKTKTPPKLQGISLKELQEDWPKGDEGRLAGRLLQRYMYSLLVDTALAAEANAVTAQAEAGAHKAFARMTRDFATLGEAVLEEKPITPLPQLHRFGKTKDDEKTKTP